MKLTCYPLVAIMSGVIFALPAQAGEEVSPKGIIAPPPIVPECSTRELSPLFSRYAQTAKALTLRAGYRSFEEMEYQEADNVDGTILDFEVIIPFNDRWQLRLYYPYDTDAEGREVATGSNLDIDGSGGLLDYPSLILDYQFKKASGPGDYNLA
ncbi:MAG: hypothetical protein KJO79_10180, partial [Verrucomicrobiae bacterium]|nr:hypothetical protein [Verrucomicrobiae bacterium]NNJ87537.1 hypothetical protein [Akkermansiaceae bacterium]